MSAPLADVVTVAMARHFARWQVAAVIGPTSAVAAELARRVLSPDLAVLGAMTAADAPAGPAMLGLEWGVLPSERHDIRDLFALVAQGRVAIFATPAQVDSKGCANLGGIGGWKRPKVALPGSRGLPDNAASLPGFAYWVPSSRALVAEVDYVSAPAPPADWERTVLTRDGVFSIGLAGWRCLSLHGDRKPDAPFAIADLEQAPRTAPPSTDEAAAMDEIDPEGVREIELR
jgi:glutaconate CoA-transferase subunit B